MARPLWGLWPLVPLAFGCFGFGPLALCALVFGSSEVFFLLIPPLMGDPFIFQGPPSPWKVVLMSIAPIAFKITQLFLLQFDHPTVHSGYVDVSL